jgi:hypothetical protein
MNGSPYFLGSDFRREERWPVRWANSLRWSNRPQVTTNTISTAPSTLAITG